MSNNLEKLRELALERGWNDSMALNLACSFIDHQEEAVQNGFEEFLDRVVQEENEISKETDDEDLVRLNERNACS